MHQNYWFQRWSMFTKMQTLIKNVEENKRTGIDAKALKLAEKFAREELLVIHYSKSKQVPESLAKEYIYTDKICELEAQVVRLEKQLELQNYISNMQEQSIQEYQCELQGMFEKQTE